MFKPKTPISERPDYSSGGWIRTTNDLRVMSKIPESVPFVRRVMQISQTDEPWFLLARHAAIPQGDDLADRCAFSSLFTRVRQVLFLVLKAFLQNRKYPIDEFIYVYSSIVFLDHYDCLGFSRVTFLALHRAKGKP
jgi:hypothetical protein